MKGMLYKPAMRQAIKNDLKTVTRRLDGLKEINQHPDDWEFKGFDFGWGGFHFISKVEPTLSRIIKPRYKVGEVVYIKEAIHRFNQDFASYSLDFTPVMFMRSANRFRWRWTRDKLSPMFLPCEAARDFIQITDVRPERLQEITDDDAIKEGIPAFAPNGIAVCSTIPRKQYAVLWDSINKDYPWSSNVWVWRIEFKRVSR